MPLSPPPLNRIEAAPGVELARARPPRAWFDIGLTGEAGSSGVGTS